MTVTLAIVLLTVLTSVSAFQNPSLNDRMQMRPYAITHSKEFYRFITSGLIHADWWHLGINMFVLYEFGQTVENIYVSLLGNLPGRLAFLVMYVATVIISDIPTYLKYRNNPAYASIGASGGVSGVLFSFILFYPWSQLNLYFFLPIPAIIFGVLYLMYSHWASKNQNDRINHDAHLYGALAGMIITIALNPSALSIFINQLSKGFSF